MAVPGLTRVILIYNVAGALAGYAEQQAAHHLAVSQTVEVPPTGADSQSAAWRQHDAPSGDASSRIIRRQVLQSGREGFVQSHPLAAAVKVDDMRQVESHRAPKAKLSLVQIMENSNRLVSQQKVSKVVSALPEDDEVAGARRACGEPWYLPNPDRCPADCPYVAEEAKNGDRSCYFRCVAADGCGTNGTRTDHTVPDATSMTCRRCNSAGCRVCEPGGFSSGQEKCSVCADGYYLMPDGACETAFFVAKPLLQTLLCVTALFILLWYFELQRRPACNEEGVRQGLAHRAQTAVVTSAGQPYALATNIAKDATVGGPGLSLHMRFQLYILSWASILCVVYMALGAFGGSDMLNVGLMPSASSPALCSLIPWSTSQAGQVLTVKLAFLAFAYIFTLVSSVIFALSQELAFQDLKQSSPTLGRFACLLQGLPPVDGCERLEEELETFVEAQTQQKPVGVSVCWDYGHVQEALEEFAQDDAAAAEPVADAEADGVGGPQQAKAAFGLIDSLWFEWVWRMPQSPPGRPVASTVKAVVEGLRCTDTAFVVFSSEEQRFAAISRFQQSNIVFRGQQLRMCLAGDVEPSDVLWHNFEEGKAGPTRSQRMIRSVIAVLVMILSYSVGFYIPFAYYSFAEPFARGEVLSGSSWATFALGVMACNQCLYVTCRGLGRSIGFKTTEEMQVWRNCAQLASAGAACLTFLTFTALISYWQMEKEQLHTGDGRWLSELQSFQEILAAYPLQRVLGSFVFMYSFPSTFLVPYMAEGVLGTGLVDAVTLAMTRSYPDVHGRRAEQAFSCRRVPNLDRYADLILNASLAILSLFFAGGYTLWVLLTFVASHACIYAYDHWRFLRASCAVRFDGQAADRSAVAAMAVPAGLLLACAVFHGAGMYGNSVAFTELAPICLFGFGAHVAMHTKLILEFVPKIAGSSQPFRKSKNMSYKDTETSVAATWFTANPVHCLRSRLIYGHQSPVSYHRVRVD